MSTSLIENLRLNEKETGYPLYPPYPLETARNHVLCKFRKVRFVDGADGEEYEFLTNAHELPAATVASLYKERPQVELFFQVDQAKSEGEELCGHKRGRGTDATLDSAVRVSAGVVRHVPQPFGTVDLADFAGCAVQFV